MLEVASPTVGRAEYTDKRADYERFAPSTTMLRFFDPVSESYIRSHEDEHASRMAAQSRAEDV